MSVSPLTLAVRQRGVLLCVGAGGVGKTTVSASLALLAALGGKNALVCTIDPARRLASALGLTELGNAETRLPLERLREAGLPSDLRLFAMMLDMKQTWDDFIRQNAPEDQQAKILENRFYRSLSSVLAGSQEYIAMDKLWQLRRERDYGLVVLDTAPTAHALDFLEAPRRVLDFLDSDATRFFLAPALAAGKWGLSLFKRSGLVARSLARFTGTELMQELANFMLVLTTLHDNFRQRARQVEGLLADAGTAFVVVTSPAPDRIDEAIEFHRHLREAKHPVAAVVVNRVPPALPPELELEIAELPRDLAGKVRQTRVEALALAERDARGIEALGRAVMPTPLVQVPQMSTDVHALGGLKEVAGYLGREQAG